MRTRRHSLVIHILTHEPKGQRQAQNHLYKWLETFGHSSGGHGFEFVSVGVLTGKRLKDAPKLSDEIDK